LFSQLTSISNQPIMVDFCGSGLLAKRRGKIPWLGTTVPLLFMRDTYSMILGNFLFFFPRNRLPHFLACWNRRVSQNNIIIVWNAIYSFLLCIWREMNARSFDDQERMDWIYGLVFLKPYLSGSLLPPFSMSLAMQFYVLFFSCS
jgi:hypothetical protein